MIFTYAMATVNADIIITAIIVAKTLQNVREILLFYIFMTALVVLKKQCLLILWLS